MISLLHILSYAGGIAGFLFVTLSLASGLLWIAELIEEHSRTAKVVGMRAIYVIIGLHVLLFVVDRLPPLLILFSILCHIVYLQNFTASWPFISLTSARFLMSCCLVVADHFLWFFYFAEKAQSAKRYNRQPKYRYGQKKDQLEVAPTFMDVAAFFAVCVWLVPLFLFLSLSANDNALPSFGGDPSMAGTPAGEIRNPIDLGDSTGSVSAQYNTYPKKPASRHSLVKTMLEPVLSLLPRVRRRARLEEGLIAPRTPIRAATLLSPSVPPSPSVYAPWGGQDDSFGNGVSPAFIERLASNHAAAGRRTAPRLTPPPPRRAMSEIHVSASPTGRPTFGASNNSIDGGERPGTPSGVASAVARSVTPSGVANGGAAMRRVPSANPDGENGKRKAD